jgi:hypothetical protein
MLLLKPGRLRYGLAVGQYQAMQQFAELRIGQGIREPHARDSLKNDIRVMCQRPKLGIEPLPQLVRAVIPRPAQIHGQLG